MKIGEKIKKLRIKKSMTQKELGEKLGGIPQQQIGRWENGKATPKLKALQKIAAALDADINDLLESPLDNSPIYRAFKNTNSLDSDLAHDVINRMLTEDINLQPIDIEMVKIFKKLNESGQAKAIERVEELTEIPRYTQDEKNQPDKTE